MTGPQLPPGAMLDLRPCEWRPGPHVPAPAYTRVRGVTLYAGPVEIDGRLWLWLAGHWPWCRLGAAGDHPPCRELLVSFAALRRRAGSPG